MRTLWNGWRWHRRFGGGGSARCGWERAGGAAALLGALMLKGATPAFADHVLLQDGTVLFNVRLEDTNSTASRPLRVHYTDFSFAYDYDRRVPYYVKLGRQTDSVAVADYVITSNTLGKAQGRKWIEARRWDRYTVPPPQVLVIEQPVAPTPTPRPTPSAELPDDVADVHLPLDRRIQRQLDLFIEQQRKLLENIQFREGLKDLTPEAGAKLKVALLMRQRKILEVYYPADDDLVKKASEALDQHAETVKKTNRFNFEDLPSFRP